MSSQARLDVAVKRVVETGNCSGCGACALLDPGIAMELDISGYLRPVRRNPPPDTQHAKAAYKDFKAACPGLRVRAQRPEGSQRHPQLGPVVQTWEAWATDPQIRHAGSSGGTLTALSSWLLDTGQVSAVTGAKGNPSNLRRTVPVRIMSREEALSAAGSRYAPVANASMSGALEPGAAFVGKPCEVSAIRALAAQAPESKESPILLSFLCAGTPSQHATQRLLADLSVTQDEPIRELRYRGQGWPGDFSVTRADGSTESASYDASWGKYLGPSTQWRCKICPDGVGESADITAGDFWRSDQHGYPIFADSDGVSALIARTERGRKLVLAAAGAGVLSLRALDVEALVSVQPLQRKRRETLLARLLGTVAAGGKIPHFSGFSLLRLASSRPRESIRTVRGTYRRRKAMRH